LANMRVGVRVRGSRDSHEVLYAFVRLRVRLRLRLRHRLRHRPRHRLRHRLRVAHMRYCTGWRT